MQNLLDCQIAKDGIDFIENKNKVLRDSIRYRFLYENANNLTDNLETAMVLGNLETWSKWYNIVYCKTITPCITTNIVYCNVFISEVESIGCTSLLTITEL
jgi:hypothetical protein